MSCDYLNVGLYLNGIFDYEFDVKNDDNFFKKSITIYYEKYMYYCKNSLIA